MILTTISKVRDDGPFSLLCKVVKVRVDYHEKFLVLRVKDFTQSVVHFRKFNVDNLRQEIYGNGPVEVWKISSRRVDVVVSHLSKELISSLQKGAVVSLQNVRCRSVQCSNFNSHVYELYINTQLGGQLLVMPCDDLNTCWRERLDERAGNDKYPYIGASTISQIRKGLSFSLTCKVVQCGRQGNRDTVVLRLMDSTLTRICTKKHDHDSLHTREQNNEEFDFFKGGSSVVDVVVTSLSQDIGDLVDETVSLGPVVCGKVTSSVPHPGSPDVHILYVDATDPSFHLVPLDARVGIVHDINRKLNSAPKTKRKRRKNSSHRHRSIMNPEP